MFLYDKGGRGLDKIFVFLIRMAFFLRATMGLKFHYLVGLLTSLREGLGKN